jgi:hypothetical protein
VLRNKAQPKRHWLDLAPGDPVVVVAGKDKGKTGEVLRTLPDKHKIVVKGVNILKRHTKAGQRRHDLLAVCLEHARRPFDARSRRLGSRSRLGGALLVRLLVLLLVRLFGRLDLAHCASVLRTRS